MLREVTKKRSQKGPITGFFGPEMKLLRTLQERFLIVRGIMDIKELQKEVMELRNARDLEQYPNPKDAATSLSLGKM
jgi:hypothetical protein